MSVSRSGQGAKFWRLHLILLAVGIGLLVLALKAATAPAAYAPAERGTIPVGEIHAPANWLIPS